MKKIAALLTSIALSFPASLLAAVEIDQFGDSTTLGLTFNGSTFVGSTPSAPDTLYSDLNARFGQGSVTVYNKGIASTCAKDLLNGTGGFQKFEALMSSSSAKIVTLNFGMNDGFYCNQTPEQYQSAMKQLVSIARARGKIVVLEEPNPTSNYQNTNLYSFIERLSQVSINTNTPIVQHYRVMTSSNFWKLLLSDGIHPTPEGYTFKGRLEFQVIAPIVQQLMSQ